MQFSTYQQEAAKTAVYPMVYFGPKDALDVQDQTIHKAGWVYPLIGLTGELGELSNKLKKVIRDGVQLTPQLREELGSEGGDIIWYISQLVTELGLDLGDIAHANLVKLADRQARGKLQGSGDAR